MTTPIDFRGPRGSNTGDQFHELWALEQVLDLLRSETDLKAVGVEGVRTETPSPNAADHYWAGVDCTLYYGGTTLESADRIEFIQLKYSAANPESEWSAARLTANTAKKGNNSTIRRLAQEFEGAKDRMKRSAQLRIRFFSNQNLAAGLKAALDTRCSGSLASAEIDEATRDDLDRLRGAAALTTSGFQEFLNVLDFSECGSHSRFAVRERVVSTVADLLGDDVIPEVRELQVRIRELMMPERAGETVTDKDILLWFGLSGQEGLFPCPSDILIPQHTVERMATDDIVALLTKGQRLVLVHGEGGCGKTTLLHQIAVRLPKGSVTVHFDCYGGGRYIYSNDKRHLPENAFLHLTNEVAQATRLPLFIPRSTKHPASIQTFLARLRLAGAALKKFTPDAKLLIVVDAADNSIVAAEAVDPPERPFVFDLFGADLSALPENVHIIASCRTARRASLRLPPHISEVTCPLFTLTESRQHLEIHFSSPSEALVEDFHALSNANPRVQAYAIAAADGNETRLLESLLPGGRSLPEVLEGSFQTALTRLGYRQVFDKLIGVLAFLPAPIAVSSIARITGCPEDTVRDFTRDLSPGLRLQGNSVTIADEDFDHYIRNQTHGDRATVMTEIAEDFMATFPADSYSSIHVADALINAGRAHDILSLIERDDPHAAAIADPIVRRQVQIRRLKLSLAACNDVDSNTDALKIILISAEAERDDRTLNEVLERELDLSMEFASSSLRRKILLDPNRVEQHGSLLAQDAARAIRSEDRVTAREQLYFHEAWLRRRREMGEEGLGTWTVTDHDISARVEVILELSGPKVAFEELRRWRPREITLRVASYLVPRLLAAGKAHFILEFLNEHFLPGPWDLLLWVPLAMAGEAVDGRAIEASLDRIRTSHIPDASQRELLDTFITACEIAYKLNLNSNVIIKSLNLIMDVVGAKQKHRLYDREDGRFDALLRCWLLRQALTGLRASDEHFIKYVTGLNPKPRSERQRKRRTQADQAMKQEDIRLERRIRAWFPVYLARLQILSSALRNQQITDDQLDETFGVNFDYDRYSSSLRDTAAQSVMGLLIVRSINATGLLERATKLAKGRSTDPLAKHRLELWARMRLRASETDNLVPLVAKAVRDIKELRVLSSEKLESIINLSRLIFPVSRDDAGSLFNDALDIAREIDFEAFDQIDFISSLAERAHISQQQERRIAAADIFSFVSGVAERLANYDRFPWAAAVDALTFVDEAVALAALGRWADDGTVTLDHTLERFLVTALQRCKIRVETAASLALLIGDSTASDLRKKLLAHIRMNPKKYETIIEELAKDTLLLSPQHRRFQLGKDILDTITEKYCREGPWLKHLRNTVAFLEDLTVRATEATSTAKLSKAKSASQGTARPHDGNVDSTSFEFDSRDREFRTPDSIAEVLREAIESGKSHDKYHLIRRMRDASSSPRDRISFLNDLVAVPPELVASTDLVEVLRGTLAAWRDTAAVERWCKEVLPEVLVKHFHGATRWLKEGQSVFRQLLNYTDASDDDRLRIIRKGVACVGEHLDSRTLFAIAEEIARTLDPEEVGAQLLWYACRLRNRLPSEDQLICSPIESPSSEGETIARFLFTLMSDIDTRIRWKAAHTLRRLAKLGSFDIVTSVIEQTKKDRDQLFRNPTAPFYSLAAKLWLSISLYRISAETPAALTSSKTRIFDLATSVDEPHVAIREYAKRTLIQLASAGVISLTPLERQQIGEVNVASKGRTARRKGVHRSFGSSRDDERRFDFDDMNTIPYWYSYILRFFPTVSSREVLKMAEQWILDNWRGDPRASWWENEPRKGRYNEQNWGLWTPSHGSFPTVERHGTYLEWNAMQCVVGELLATYPISRTRAVNSDSFEYWLARVLPTDPPGWLFDIRRPTPLEGRLWKEDSRTESGWLHNFRRAESQIEIGARSPSREGWVIVGSCYSISSSRRATDTYIRSALVSPGTAAALVRALQTASSPWDFRIPSQDDDLQIESPQYLLRGWLAYIESNVCFDERDPFRYQVSQVAAEPGRLVSEALGLVPLSGSYRTWICKATGETAFIYEAWSDEPSPGRGSYLWSNRSDGWRLWARSDMLQTFLTKEGWNLICEVQVDRRLRNEDGWYNGKYKKRKTHDRILLLRADGSVTDVKGRLGSWTSIGRGVGSRPRRGHAKSLDGSLHRGVD